ncbi:glycosyltransferase family 39 protein [Pseudobacteriovorax antillogorgiicola]|uniref:Dolichyl-phosphate-mannose-protein mannosyltransferase n=1 Tax=Pseudobacteriovorax antillogorgiicola TaxID=1513793 RepID=A0A1Y6C3E4_9BACT|nr:glycosyltransferase family 39 protein [Pseudobacteriovorax antillogorgiicola]TCS50294.1 dolichyl-phosphate-mannose-protein mannosyltransferase [Pseudobacteriovorax antillogorgiicola]SMF33928.1 Dolichyl-phosphate-mannose-protein mannosyltransferase [Pseudobacteriovorax antillogorgiicola]
MSLLVRAISIRSIGALCLLTIGFRLLQIAVFPVTQDEAYYFYWAKFPDFGYFDHPPFIAWLASLSNIIPGTPWAARLGGFLLASLMFTVMISLARLAGLKDRSSIYLALLLSQLNLGGLILGFIQTPDLPLAFFWLLALHEAAVAIKIDPRRWLTAGVMTGLGLTSKYTMAIMGLVFLYALMRKPRGLLSPWPYLGGLACLITFLPHLTWNYQHDWVSFRFQFGRGLKSEYHVDTNMGNKLPRALDAKVGSPEETLARTFKRPEKKKEPKPPKSKIEKASQRVGNYIGGQLGLWGLMIFPLAIGLWRKRQKNSLDPHVRSLLIASVTVPLGVFGILSPFQNIEANWPAVYVLGASVLLAGSLKLRPALYITGLGNLILIALLTIHAHYPLNKSKAHKDRILYETHGYEDLASYLKQVPGPLFADTYQNTSLISFYNPSQAVTQWPGITRLSEMIRRPEMMKTSYQTALESDQIFLITSNRIPPAIPGFSAKMLWELRDCVDGEFQIFSADDSRYLDLSCEKAVHRWTLAEYKPNTP